MWSMGLCFKMNSPEVKVQFIFSDHQLFLASDNVLHIRKTSIITIFFRSFLRFNLMKYLVLMAVPE